MEFLHQLGFGMGVVLAPPELAVVLLAWIVGALCAALPGLRPVAIMALLLPVTLRLSALASLLLLAGVYGGLQYGGLLRAMLAGALTRPPGLLSAYRRLRQRQWREALVEVRLGPLLAGWAGVLALALSSLWLNGWAQQLGAAESLALMLLLLVASVVLTPGPVLKALPMALLGLLGGLVGLDTQSGTVRFAIELPVLGLSNMHGIGILAMAIGVFAYGDVIHRLAHPGGVGDAPVLRPSLAAANPRPPGPLSMRTLSALVWLPLLALGLPSQGVLALVAASLVMHQVPLGAHMLDGRPELFWGMLASLMLGMLLLWLLQRPLLVLWRPLQRVPYRWLFALLLLLGAMGVYSSSHSTLDVWLLGVAGVVGYAMRRLAMEPMPLLLGFVLAPLMEERLRQSLQLAHGDWSVFVMQPLAASLLLAALCAPLLLLPALKLRLAQEPPAS